MKVIMRLYRQHDLDLIYLHSIKGFSLQQSIKGALYAYVHQKPYSINVTVPPKHDAAALPKQVQFHILLNNETDAELIDWILSLSRGYRNSALKNLIRGYLALPNMIPYLNDFDLSFKQDMTQELRKVVAESKLTDENNVQNVKNLVESVLSTPVPAAKQEVVLKESDDILQETSQGDESTDWFNAFESIIN